MVAPQKKKKCCPSKGDRAVARGGNTKGIGLCALTGLDVCVFWSICKYKGVRRCERPSAHNLTSRRPRNSDNTGSDSRGGDRLLEG